MNGPRPTLAIITSRAGGVREHVKNTVPEIVPELDDRQWEENEPGVTEEVRNRWESATFWDQTA